MVRRHRRDRQPVAPSQRSQSSGVNRASARWLPKPMTLIDRYLPVYQFSERHQLLAEATPAALLDAAASPSTTDDPWARSFIRLREFPDRLMGALGSTSGLKNRAAFGFHSFTPLGRDADRELAFGLVGKFWKSDYGSVAIDGPKSFEAFAEPGVAKLVLNFSAESSGDGRTWLRTQTRVFCNDRASTLRFTPYWYLIRPVSGLIRRRLLARIRDAAAVSAVPPMPDASSAKKR